MDWKHIPRRGTANQSSFLSKIQLNGKDISYSKIQKETEIQVARSSPML